MLKAVKVNENVRVVATFEDQEDNGFTCEPIKMEFRGREVRFGKFRINYSDAAATDEKVFDLFDEERRYRVIFNMENLSWLLSSVSARNA